MSFILKGVFHASNFIGLIPSCSVHQMLPIFSGAICCERLYQSSRKEKQSRCLVFSFSTKCEIRHFQVVVMYWRQRNVQKSVMHVQSCCFANNFLWTYCFFCHCLWRHRGHFISALFKNRQILKFKSQLTIVFFVALNRLNGPLRNKTLL